jgi:hypothetical protein
MIRNVVFLFALIIVSCGFGKDLLLRISSPDKAFTIAIWEIRHGPDSSLIITLAARGVEARIYEDDRDRAPGVAEVYWSPDRKLVGVFVCDPYAGNLIFGWDLTRNRRTKPQQVEAGLRQTVKQRYALDTETLQTFANDPFQWACESDDAPTRYRRELDHRLNLRPVSVATGQSDARF